MAKMESEWMMNLKIMRLIFEIANGVEDLFYFAENDRIVKVSMADSMKKIEDRVFQYCHNLSEIQLSKNLESIEEEAFYECTSLKKISLKKLQRLKQ